MVAGEQAADVGDGLPRILTQEVHREVPGVGDLAVAAPAAHIRRLSIGPPADRHQHGVGVRCVIRVRYDRRQRRQGLLNDLAGRLAADERHICKDAVQIAFELADRRAAAFGDRLQRRIGQLVRVLGRLGAQNRQARLE